MTEETAKQDKTSDAPGTTDSAPAPVAEVKKPTSAEATEKAPETKEKSDKKAEPTAEKGADTPEPKKDELESSVRDRIEKEIANRKADSTATVPAAIDPSKTATIEAEMRKKLDEEVSRRQQDKEKADKKKDESSKKPDDTKKEAEKGKKGKKDGEVGKKKANGKEKGGANGKKPRRKRPGSQTRPQLSENEQRILEEKARIDKKLKARNKYIYAAITILTFIGLIIVGQISKKNSAAAPRPAPLNTVKEVETTVVGSSTARKRQSSTFKAANKEAQKIMASKDYQGAVDFLTNHAEKFPKDQEACDKAIKMINDNFINPVALPDKDPKAQWSPEERRKARERAERKRLIREGVIAPRSDGDEGFGSVDEMKIEDPTPVAAPAAPEPMLNDDPFGFDDSGLKEEPKKEEVEKDPLDELDTLLD